MLGSLRNRLIISLFIFLFLINLVSATWWNESWQYKKPVNLSKSSGSTQTDYQILLNVTYESNMNASFKDLRFTNSTEDLELDYWIERKVDSSWANVWIEVSENITTANQTLVYMYYGNPTVSSKSNGTTTFPQFFDDFNDQNISDWDAYGDHNFSAGRYDGYSLCVITTAQLFSEAITGTLDYSHAFDMEYIGYSSGTDGTSFFGRISTVIEYGFTQHYPTANKFGWRPENVWNTGTFAFSPSTWYSMEIVYDRENSANNNSADGGASYDNYAVASLGTIDEAILYGYASWGCFDDIRVRKYHYPEPIYSVGAEESVPPVDTCTCAGAGNNWEIDMSDYCNITEACDLTTGTLSFTGAGYCNCNASVDTTNLGDPGANGILYIQDSCLITID